MSGLKLKTMHIPNHPEDHEKHMYLHHGQHWLTFFSVIGFVGVLFSSIRFFGTNPILYIFYPFLAFTSIYYVISMFVQGFGNKFDADSHFSVVKKWKPTKFHTVDVFLPVCGEDLRIIHNTWVGVRNMQNKYTGEVNVYCLDDGGDPKVKELAEKFEFNYLVRDNRGHYKKAGNLRHGFNNSNSEFIAIFDADFRPRADFLDELLPYFDLDPRLGIVQSPQYFDVHKGQNWLERGAGAVQEYFYRSVQQNRQEHNGAICVGSNAVYRRKALATNGGTTLIEHSEDVHTGFDLRTKGWELLYLPVVLAKGVCPNDLSSFFRQQYRWCLGSMSLLGSKKFWEAKIPLRSRLCYISGFLYYIHTAILTIVAPLIPLALLFVVPEQAIIKNYIILIPAILYTFVIFPMWHKSDYGSEAYSVKMVYGWAHLFAIINSINGGAMEWHTTGAVSKKSTHYALFRFLLVAWSLSVAFVWVGSAIWHMVYWNAWNFLPVFLSGAIYLFAVMRIVMTTSTVKKTSGSTSQMKAVPVVS